MSAQNPEIEAFLADLLVAGVDGAVIRVQARDDLIVEHAAGSLVTPDSWFDLASLTKPFIGTLAARLDAVGVLPSDREIGSLVEGLTTPLANRSLGDLLRHRSGLVAWIPFYAGSNARESPLDLILDNAQLGANEPTYSDLGYILWGKLVERELGTPLADLLRVHVLDPLALTDRVAAHPGIRSGIVPCRLDNAVEVRLAGALETAVADDSSSRVGVPQDGNARYLSRRGELLGHSGLFGSAAAMAALGGSWLQDRLLSSEVRASALASRSRYTQGWWRYESKVEGGDLPGPEFSPASFGMVGFTGGSCWIDPNRELIAVLLAHRRTTKLDMQPWRDRFHTLAVRLSERQR